MSRSPTFSTTTDTLEAEAADGGGHQSRVTSVRALPEHRGQGDDDHDGIGAFRIVSAEERGAVIIWTVLDSRHDPDQHLGMAHWGTIRWVGVTNYYH